MPSCIGIVLAFSILTSFGRTSGQDFTEVETYEQVEILVREYRNRDQTERAIEVLEWAKIKFHDDLYSIISQLTLYYPQCNRFDGVMDAWEYGQARGFFFPAKYKRYEPLFGTERYERFLKTNDRFHAEAQARNHAEYEVVLPSEYDTTERYPVFISMHGDNNNNRTFKKYWRLDSLSDRYILAFFQSSRLSGTDRFVWSENKEQSKKDVVQLYKQLCDEYAIDESRIIIGGFSSGGALAMDAALQNLIPAKGFIAVCPAGIDTYEEDFRSLMEAGDRNVSGYILCGEKDVFALDEQKQVAGLFDEAGFRYRMIVIPGMGHSYPDDLDERIRDALHFIDDEDDR